jgi:non-specific protein-tyrosine kinase
VGRSWRLVLAITLAVTALGAALALSRPAAYRAHTQVFVAATVTTEDADQVALANTYIQGRVPSYLSVATSPTVVNAVINQLDLDLEYDDLASRVLATATPTTVLIDLSISDEDPELAAQMVDVLAERFAAVVADIERTPASGDRSPVQLRVTGPALVPTDDGSSGAIFLIAFAFVVGLALAVAVAVLRARLDHRVKDADLLAELVGAPVLAVVPRGARRVHRPGTRQAAAADPRAEAWRLLRTNIAFLDVDDPPTVVAVTSALPGEGKTTTALGLARALVEAGRKVVLVEADLRKPVLTDNLGLGEGPGLRGVLQDGVDWTEALREAEGLDVLPAGSAPPNPSTLLDGVRLAEVLAALDEAYEAVVVDTAPLLAVSDGSQVAARAQAVLLVVRARRTTHEQVGAAVEALDRVGVRPSGAVLTFASRRA